MSMYRKPFLSLLAEHWATRFPDWHRGRYVPVSWAAQDATFSNDTALATRGRLFHTVIDFSSKWPGTFTADIVVTPTPEPLTSTTPQRWPDDIPRLVPGSYRIGWFVASRDIWWHLHDEVAEFKQRWESIPSVEASPVAFERYPHHWYAASYDTPLRKIMQDAVQHFSDTFEQHVLPKLNSNV